MRAALEVNAETAKKLRSIAKEQKVSLDELLSAHIPGLTSAGSPSNGGTPEDQIRAFDLWVKSFPKNTAPLSDEAISRESIYRDR
jgi:hypothetical protein